MYRDVIGELKCVKYGKKQGGEIVTNGRPSQKAYVYTRTQNRTGMGNNKPIRTKPENIKAKIKTNTSKHEKEKMQC